MKLSKNFSLSEFTKSQTAIRKGIDNTPTPEALRNLQTLVNKVLQPIRDQIGPVTVSSGYRSLSLNKAVGGSKTSHHSLGYAADIECPGVDNFVLAKHIQDHLPFTQLILEFYEPGVPDSGWIHVSYVEGDLKKEVLRAFKSNGRTKYERVEL